MTDKNPRPEDVSWEDLHMTPELRRQYEEAYRAQQRMLCTYPECEDTGWVPDESACGDEDHCNPLRPCPECNPEGERQ